MIVQELRDSGDRAPYANLYYLAAEQFWTAMIRFINRV